MNLDEPVFLRELKCVGQEVQNDLEDAPLVDLQPGVHVGLESINGKVQGYVLVLSLKHDDEECLLNDFD